MNTLHDLGEEKAEVVVMMGSGHLVQHGEVKCPCRLSVIRTEVRPYDKALKANISSEDKVDQAVTGKRESGVKTNRNARKSVLNSSPILH